MKSHFPTLLSDSRVLIVGLGLMGGSLALGLKGKCKNIYGFELDGSVREIALRNQFVDAAFADWHEVPQSDLIILAVPVGKIIEILNQLDTWIATPAVVMDIGSTKQEIIKTMSKIDERFDPIGGHPMCGKEVLGIQNADAAIYHSAPFALIPLERTSERAKSLVSQLVQSVGGKSIWLDAETHDRWVAAVSHLPYLLASALTLGTPLESSMLIGSGFRSTARLAATPTSMMADVLQTNREQIIQAMTKVENEWRLLRNLLESGQDAALIEQLNQASLKIKTMLKLETMR